MANESGGGGSSQLLAGVCRALQIILKLGSPETQLFPTFEETKWGGGVMALVIGYPSVSVPVVVDRCLDGHLIIKLLPCLSPNYLGKCQSPEMGV